jgi:hypothetical protein
MKASKGTHKSDAHGEAHAPGARLTPPVLMEEEKARARAKTLAEKLDPRHMLPRGYKERNAAAGREEKTLSLKIADNMEELVLTEKQYDAPDMVDASKIIARINMDLVWKRHAEKDGEPDPPPLLIAPKGMLPHPEQYAAFVKMPPKEYFAPDGRELRAYDVSIVGPSGDTVMELKFVVSRSVDSNEDARLLAANLQMAGKAMVFCAEYVELSDLTEQERNMKNIHGRREIRGLERLDRGEGLLEINRQIAEQFELFFMRCRAQIWRKGHLPEGRGDSYKKFLTDGSATPEKEKSTQVMAPESQYSGRISDNFRLRLEEIIREARNSGFAILGKDEFGALGRYAATYLGANEVIWHNDGEKIVCISWKLFQSITQRVSGDMARREEPDIQKIAMYTGAPLEIVEAISSNMGKATGFFLSENRLLDGGYAVFNSQNEASRMLGIVWSTSIENVAYPFAYNSDICERYVVFKMEKLVEIDAKITELKAEGLSAAGDIAQELSLPPVVVKAAMHFVELGYSFDELQPDEPGMVSDRKRIEGRT